MAEDLISDKFIEALTQNQIAIKSYIRASMGNQSDADDVAQKTNLVLWKKASQWDDQTPFLRWAFALAKFEILSYYRDRSRDKLLFDDDVVEMMDDESAEIAHDIPSRVLALRSCLNAMKQQHQQLLAAKYVTKMTTQQMATLADKSEDGIKSLLLRLRKKLGECITTKIEKLS